MTSIGCDCTILVIMNGYVHLESEGGQYVVTRELQSWSPRGCLLQCLFQRGQFRKNRTITVL